MIIIISLPIFWLLTSLPPSPEQGQYIYVQWEDDGSSEEAPGWYFAKIKAVTPDNLFKRTYGDGATEVTLKIECLQFYRSKSCVQC